MDPFHNHHQGAYPPIPQQQQQQQQAMGNLGLAAPGHPQQQQLQQQQHSQQQQGGPSAPANKYVCNNCGKAFARDDLLRRHLAREARALAQPQFDRQKSCYECARSKARCDLAVPSCGRCRSRGKTCHYGARSGNPNVRRHRESMAPPNNLAGMSISGSGSGSSETPYMVGHGWQPQYQHGHLPSHGHSHNDSLSDTSQSSHGSHPYSHRRYSSSESGSESGSASWAADSNHSGFELGRPSRTNSMSSTDSGVAAASDALQHHYSTAAPGSGAGAGATYMDNAITPTTYLASAGFGPGPASSSSSHRPQGQTLVTDIDRSAPQFKTDEGEETPIGRLVNSFGAGPSSMDPRTGGPDLARLRAQQHQQQQQQQDQASSSSSSWAQPGLPSAAADSSSLHSMGPPSLPFLSKPMGATSAMSGPPSAVGRGSQKPQPHRLLTGVNMPQPTPPSHAVLNPMSGRPLFSAMVDLSGWLEEPVVPSPLYPTGPSLSSLPANGGIPTGLAPPPVPPPDSTMQEPPAEQQQQQQAGVAFPGSTTDPSGFMNSTQMPASRYWWANPPSQSDALLMHSVAQATATHLSHYPHLMVLPDPSSPVPPTVHRPWMAHIRGNIPAPLAVARVVLAGFAVRLPASEHVVWEGVSRETQRIIVAHEAISTNGTDLEVFGATVALFFYCILLMMCTDAGATGHVTMELTNSAFFGLSELSKSLSARLRNAQNARTAESFNSSTKRQDWMSWGFEETMRRTLWAAYAILVLQRFRDGAVLSEGHLAGIDLLLDIQLPAVASEFEAGSEEEWRKARGEVVAGEGETTTHPTPAFTFRDLIIHRPRSSSSTNTPEPGVGNSNGNGNGNGNGSTTDSSSASTPAIQTGAEGSAPQALLDYFDRHDAFVATVLSIAFCLDSSLST